MKGVFWFILWLSKLTNENLTILIYLYLCIVILFSYSTQIFTSKHLSIRLNIQLLIRHKCSGNTPLPACELEGYLFNYRKYWNIIILHSRTAGIPYCWKQHLVNMAINWEWFLGLNITNKLWWSIHNEATAKKAHECMYFLRRLRRFSMSPATRTMHSMVQLHHRKHTIGMCHSLVDNSWPRQQEVAVMDVAQSITQCKPTSLPPTPTPSTASTFYTSSDKQPT